MSPLNPFSVVIAASTIVCCAAAIVVVNTLPVVPSRAASDANPNPSVFDLIAVLLITSVAFSPT